MYPGKGGYKPIVFEKNTVQISRNGGSETISCEDGKWSISKSYEIIGSDTLVNLNDIKIINDINYFKDTLLGEWYSIYKIDNKLKVELAPNLSDQERSLLINIIELMCSDANIKITQE